MTTVRQPTRLPKRPDDQHQPMRPAASRYPEAPAGQLAAAETTNYQPAEPLLGRIAYSVAEAAFITGLSRDLLYAQMRAGKLDYLKVGRRRLITRRNLENFLYSLTT